MDKNKNKFKINLAACDLQDYNEEYDPFMPINDLDRAFSRNKFSKINREKSKDNGIYIIADNRLALYPHYKNTLINKNTSNDNPNWSVGIFDKKSLL